MSWLSKIFGAKKAKIDFSKADWTSIEGGLTQAEGLNATGAQNNLRQAIIQADSLLDSLMKQAGVPGQTMGERLRAIQPLLDRKVYNQLWEAHKKRNELVHEPTSFVAQWEKDSYVKMIKEGIRALRWQKK